MNENRLPPGFSACFLEYCDSCPEFEVECSSAKLFADGDTIEVHHTITCKHLTKCFGLCKRMKDKTV